MTPRSLPPPAVMLPRVLDHRAIVRLILDKAELGGAVLDVDILDRMLGHRHEGLEIHKLYFTTGTDSPHVERVGASTVHWHPIAYTKATAGEDGARLIGELRSAFTRIVDGARPALFVNHVPENPTGFLLSQEARRRGLPVLAMFHGGNRPDVVVDAEHARAIDVVAANLRASAGFADMMGAVSESAGRMIPTARVRNFWTAADAEHFDPARAVAGFLRERFDRPVTMPILLLSARIVPEKGHKLLLDASQILFDRRVDHRIVFAGNASPQIRAALENYVRQNGFGVNVRILYDASQDQMVSVYGDADIVVLPTFHFEGCPRCLVEAGLMEKPVVASDAGGSREAFVPGETGILVPPGDAHALADALEKLIRDPPLRAAMGRAGRTWAKARFDPTALAERHEAVYATLMGARRG